MDRTKIGITKSLLRCLDKKSKNLLSRIANINEKELSDNVSAGRLLDVISLTARNQIIPILMAYNHDKQYDDMDADVLIDSIFGLHLPVPNSIGLSSEDRIKKVETRGSSGLKLWKYLHELNNNLNYGSVIYTAVLALGDDTKDAKIGDCITVLFKNPILATRLGKELDSVVDILAPRQKDIKDTPLSFNDLFYNTGVNRTYEDILLTRHDTESQEGSIDIRKTYAPFAEITDKFTSIVALHTFPKATILYDKVRKGGTSPVVSVNILYSPASNKCSLSILFNSKFYGVQGYTKNTRNYYSYHSGISSTDEIENKALDFILKAYNTLRGKKFYKSTSNDSDRIKAMLSVIGSSRHKIKVGPPIVKAEPFVEFTGVEEAVIEKAWDVNKHGYKGYKGYVPKADTAAMPVDVPVAVGQPIGVQFDELQYQEDEEHNAHLEDMEFMDELELTIKKANDAGKQIT